MRRIGFLLALVGVCAAGLAREAAEMKPFDTQWRTDSEDALDLSGMFEKPAGRDGFVRVRDGHLVTGSGRRLRLWGVNLTGGACYPEKADAPAVAACLARLGINAVRLHFLDSAWGSKASIFPPKAASDTTRKLDPGQLQKLDFFIAELKKRGIYTNINLNVGRVYREGDGVVDHEFIGLGKALQYFDDRIQDLHVEYATQLMKHRNPYTGNEYRREPAVVTVELVNENSLIESWFNDRLVGRQDGKRGGTWCDITSHYERLLTRKFNEHLAAHHAEKLPAWRKQANVSEGRPLPRLTKGQFPKADAERFAAEAGFYMHLEDAYFQRMARALDELGVRAPVVGTSDHNHYRSGYALVHSTGKLDIVDGHVYWQHPSKTYDEKGKRTGFRIGNSPMVAEPTWSTVVQLCRTAVAGKPYTVSEVNHPFPNEYACEGVAILAAYALLHDWDGIYWYTFDHADPTEWADRRPGHFDVRPDPVKLSQIAAMAGAFHRGDVAAAEETVYRSYSKRQVIEAIRMPSRGNRPMFTPGFHPAIPLVHATRIRGFDKARTDYPDFRQPRKIVSDTGELTWRSGRRGLVTVRTPRTEALVGFVGGAPHRLDVLGAEVDTEFCSLVLTSLDGLPLRRSKRMLLAAGARAITTGAAWSEDRRSLTRWGRRPMRIEPVVGTVRLAGRSGLAATALDGAGAPLAEPQRGKADEDGQTLPLNKATVWYLIEAE